MSEKNAVLLSWAPPGAVWSKWVKPVLFGFMEAEPPAIRAAESLTLSGVPTAGGDTALMLWTVMSSPQPPLFSSESWLEQVAGGADPRILIIATRPV